MQILYKLLTTPRTLHIFLYVESELAEKFINVVAQTRIKVIQFVIERPIWEATPSYIYKSTISIQKASALFCLTRVYLWSIYAIMYFRLSPMQIRRHHCQDYSSHLPTSSFKNREIIGI